MVQMRELLTTRQQRTQTLHGGAHGHIAELLVHVVSAAARVVTDLDAVVVHNAAVLLTDLLMMMMSERSTKGRREGGQMGERLDGDCGVVQQQQQQAPC